MKGTTKNHFTMRCKLRGTTVEIVVMDKTNDDVYALSWDISKDTVKVSSEVINETDDFASDEVTSDSDSVTDEVIEQIKDGGNE